MEHVEVLRDLSEVCRAAIDAGDWVVDGACDPDAVLRRADAAIASLSAPQPPAEAQPVAWQFQDRDGKWHGFTDESHRLNTIEDGSWPVRALYAHPPPSAPVGVEAKDAEIEALRAEVERLTFEMGCLRQHYDERTACMIVHRGSALACSAAVRAAYSEEHERAERLAEALRLIAAPQRSDGTWNRDREACRQIAEEALRDHDQEVGNG